MNKIINRAIIRLEVRRNKITTNFYNLKFHVSSHQVKCSYFAENVLIQLTLSYLVILNLIQVSNVF